MHTKSNNSATTIFPLNWLKDIRYIYIYIGINKYRNMPKNIMEVGRLEKELAKERERTREAREACMELFEVAKDIARERDELRAAERQRRHNIYIRLVN